MSSIKDAAIGFEAVKVSMSQDKNGIMLRLNVHPNDCPQELHTDWVGTRYMVAMVRLNDQDEPEPREEAVNVERLIASAGLLCRNDDFHDYLYSMGMTEKTDVFNQEKEAACLQIDISLGDRRTFMILRHFSFLSIPRFHFSSTVSF